MGSFVEYKGKPKVCKKYLSMHQIQLIRTLITMNDQTWHALLQTGYHLNRQKELSHSYLVVQVR